MSNPFTREIEQEVRELKDCGEDAVVIIDDPAKYPPQLRGTLDGRSRRWFLSNWPPQRLLPDTEAYYVKSWLYTMGVATLVSLVLLIITGVILAVFGPEWWTTTMLGGFVDSLHYWAVQLFFLFMAVHFISVFLMGAFRGRRWQTWMLGVLAFMTAVVAAFTGYASLQDWESQWITTQGKDAINSTGMGALFNLLNPGQMITMHVILLPAIVIGVVAIHLLFVRKHEIAPPYDALEEHLAPVEVSK